MTTKDDIIRWVEAYRAAWTTNDPEQIAALFTEHAAYEFRPNDPDPWRGRDAIVRGWIEEKDDPQSWRFDFTVVGIMENTAVNELGMSVPADATAVVQAATEYLDERPTYENLWFITLTASGQASAFTEWYMIRKGTETEA
jgi:hypothetical protein